MLRNVSGGREVSMSPPNLIWNKKTMRHLLFPLLMTVAILVFWYLSCTASYREGVKDGKEEWDEITESLQDAIIGYTEEGVALFCSREIYEEQQFYLVQMDRTDMCSADWMRHNQRLTAYERLYGPITDEEIGWAYDQIDEENRSEEFKLTTTPSPGDMYWDVEGKLWKADNQSVWRAQ